MVMHTTANNQRETQVVAQSSQPGAEQISSQEASSFEVSFLSRCGLPIIPVLSGLIDIFGYAVEGLKSYFPDDIDWMLHHWGQQGEPTENWGRWPTDATGDIRPVNCHSHNDYWRSVPLYEAIHAGCTGAEADVWLVDDELYVGHRRYALAQNRTLQNLYLEPLLKLLNKQNPPIKYQPDEDYPDPLVDKFALNGIFDVDPSQTFVLLIDFKSFGPALWQKLNEQLTALREKGYLTYFNGISIVENPITVVGTGNAPFDLLAAESYRDVFFDAPLDEMADLSTHWPNPNRAQDVTRARVDYRILPKTTTTSSPSQTPSLANILHTDHQTGTSSTLNLTRSTSLPTAADVYNSTNSYYASTSFTRSVGRVWGSRLTQNQLQLIRGQIRGAHAGGLKVRYWGLPQWPIGLRNHVWHILIREGVDMLNVDDVRGGTQRDWRRSRRRKNG
ncbi:Altered inheritance of mitochondria protein 6 [Exophiala xenobiotica]|nr:Altered inheritance of mitochondria protein 6 [Exophiala xenobiotica]KAK5311568.1 Altered inheritance of mitochondria protein 6 [Exophiala xenobiotica]